LLLQFAPCVTRPVTALAPPDYKALHPIGAAPVIADGNLVLGAPSGFKALEFELHQAREAYETARTTSRVRASFGPNW
jgi:hypothetical protein